MSGLIQKLKCIAGNHERQFDRATNYNKDGYWHDDGEKRLPLDACTVIDKCIHCGDEIPVAAPITVVERRNIPKDWEDGDSCDETVYDETKRDKKS